MVNSPFIRTLKQQLYGTTSGKLAKSNVLGLSNYFIVQSFIAIRTRYILATESNYVNFYFIVLMPIIN